MAKKKKFMLYRETNLLLIKRSGYSFIQWRRLKKKKIKHDVKLLNKYSVSQIQVWEKNVEKKFKLTQNLIFELLIKQIIKHDKNTVIKH
jgi:hypothetical protein